MKRISLAEMNTDDLVELFAHIVEAQDEALLAGENAKFNRLFGRMMEVSDELKSRDGDERRHLLQLFDSPTMQVRLQVSKCTMSVAPIESLAHVRGLAD